MQSETSQHACWAITFSTRITRLGQRIDELASTRVRERGSGETQRGVAVELCS